jgi:hypothetical protein
MALLAQADRIAGQFDASHLSKMAGTINPQARPETDEGPVNPAMKLNYVRLMLKPTPAQQGDLNRLLRESSGRFAELSQMVEARGVCRPVRSQPRGHRQGHYLDAFRRL